MWLKESCFTLVASVNHAQFVTADLVRITDAFLPYPLILVVLVLSRRDFSIFSMSGN